jgi:hypothetical protein
MGEWHEAEAEAWNAKRRKVKCRRDHNDIFLDDPCSSGQCQWPKCEFKGDDADKIEQQPKQDAKE